MKKLFITIQETEYQLKFGFGVLRVFCGLYGRDDIKAVDELIQPLSTVLDNPTFESLDVLGNVVLAGIMYGSLNEVKLTPDDVVEAMMNQPEKIAEIFVAFANSLPNVKSVGKQKAVKKQPQKKPNQN